MEFYCEGNLHKGILVFKTDSEDSALNIIKRTIRNNTGSSDPVYTSIKNASSIGEAIQLLGFDVKVDGNTYILAQKNKYFLHQAIWYTAGYDLLSKLEDYIQDGSIIETDNGFDQLYTFKIINGCLTEEWNSIYLNSDGTYVKDEFENTQAD